MMRSNEDDRLNEVLNWCSSVLGPFEVVSNHSQVHLGHRAEVHRLRTSSGYCYVKSYRDQSHWDSEVHGYERWAGAFGTSAAKLLAVRDEEPLALIISELPGKILKGLELSAQEEQKVWRGAGQALVALHDLGEGEYFGPCQRDGTCVGTPISDAKEYVLSRLDNGIERGSRGGYLTADEQATVRAARALVPAFEGETPIPCHRDYSPANWLVSSDGVWAGVIDFEFAYWDVRVTDFSRYPDWEWIGRPDLMEAFFDGYGRSFTPEEEQQRMVGHALYAIDAIVWGRENSYHGFAQEGHLALKRLGELLP